MPEPRRLSTADAGFGAALERLLAFEATQDAAVERATGEILEAVRTRGDAALLEFTARFDRWTPASAASLQVPIEDARAALRDLPAGEREALELAAARIRTYHERQVQDSWRVDGGDGTVLGQQVTPIDRVGLYVPGGKAAYPSSVLMSAIAAKVAGVGELVMVTPTPDVFNMCLFALPMCVLFYVGIFAGYLLVLHRENRKFPWARVIKVTLIVLLAIAGMLYVAIAKYGYKIVPHWPFLKH